MKDNNFEAAKQAYGELVDLITSLKCDCDDCNILRQYVTVFNEVVKVAEEHDDKFVYVTCAYILGCLYNGDEGKAFWQVYNLISSVAGELRI